MSLNAPFTPNTIIQSTQVSNDLTGLANGTNDTTNNSMATYRSDVVFDHVASGCVWSADSVGATKNGSLTAGVVYNAGVRLSVGLLSAHLFTASKDTYTDVNSSGTVIFTEVTNNAASPALSAGSVRIGIIVTGAASIATTGSINQGQESIVLPIASSIPYAVTDSLGNLICPRDPNRKILGYRQILANFNAGTNAQTDVTSLNFTIIVPANRKVKISGNATLFQSGTIRSCYIQIMEGATQLTQAGATSGAALGSAFVKPEYLISATTGTHTYKISISCDAGANVSVIGSSTNAAFIEARLD